MKLRTVWHGEFSLAVWRSAAGTQWVRTHPCRSSVVLCLQCAGLKSGENIFTFLLLLILSFVTLKAGRNPTKSLLFGVQFPDSQPLWLSISCAPPAQKSWVNKEKRFTPWWLVAGVFLLLLFNPSAHDSSQLSSRWCPLVLQRFCAGRQYGDPCSAFGSVPALVLSSKLKLLRCTRKSGCLSSSELVLVRVSCFDEIP